MLFKSEPSSQNNTPAWQLQELSEEVWSQLVDIYQFPENVDRTLSNLKREFLKKMPKTDLHVHGEAGFLIDETLARDLANRNDIKFPEEILGQDALWQYRGKENFLQFIRDFLTISTLIRKPQDVEDIAYSFYKNCYENNVIYSLPGISWYQCKEHMSFSEFNAAYHRAMARGAREFGGVALLQLRYYLERHLKREDFEDIFQTIMNHPQGLITTIGLAGAEEGHPLKDFENYYKIVKEQRIQTNGHWFFLTAHMEYFSNHETILESLQWLDWVAHGRRVAENDGAMETLGISDIMLESCPLSDVCVYPKEFPELQNHQQLKILLEKGLVSLNSDDPGMFGTIDQVYQQVFEKLGVSFSTLLHCTWRGIHPASPAALIEMKEFQQNAYEDYIEIQSCSELKIRFFQCYWKLLPHALDLEESLAKNILKIDLKTSFQDLRKLKEQAPGNTDAYNTISELVKLKYDIDKTTKNILEKMEKSVEQVLSFSAQSGFEFK